jgi:phosphoketolase
MLEVAIAGTNHSGDPHAAVRVMACCGDVPTLETPPTVELICKHLPELNARVIDVVYLL